MLDHTTTQWLAELHQTSITNIECILRNEKATTYLFVWAEFEQRLFSGFVHSSDLEGKANQLAAYYNDLALDELAKAFHQRYQDKTKYRHLIHAEKPKEIQTILNKDFIRTTNSERLHLLLYVVYRYRNNIFHGNKGVRSWLQYTDQINSCISIMIRIIDICRSRK